MGFGLAFFLLGATAIHTADFGLTALMIIIGAGVAAAGTAAQVAAAQQQRKAVEDQNKYQRLLAAQRNEQISVQQKQIANRETATRAELLRRATGERGSITAATAESGIGFGGTWDAFLRQADYEAATNVAINTLNAALESQAAASGSYTPNYGRANDPLLDAGLAGISGLSTGLSVASAGIGIARALKSTPRDSTYASRQYDAANMPTGPHVL